MAAQPAASTASPLSSLTTLSSTPSFRTAKASLSAGTGDATNLSSPGEEPGPPPYREARQLPHELKEHCQIHLEERLYGSALFLLDSTLSASSARKDPSLSKPALVPPPNHISLLATLAIHPLHTSRCREPADVQVSSQALEYLRNLSATVGPVNANLRAAFEFQGGSSRSARRNRLGAYETDSDGGDDVHGDQLEGSLANEASLWSSAPDFWTALGWAFRCSVAYPHRWRYWRAWLDCMVDIIQDDWSERYRLDRQRQEATAGTANDDFSLLRQSIFTMYIDALRRERKNVLREVLRSLFAFTDGTMVDAAVYKELFSNEPLTPSKSKRKRDDPALDLEHGQFGDYLDDEDLDGEEDGGPSTPVKTRPRRAKPEQGADPDPTSPGTSPSMSPGLAETVEIRLRLFALLSAASAHLPNSSYPIGELYDKFATSVRGLPLDMFRLFIGSHNTPLPEDVYVSFLRHIIDKLLPSNHPDPASVDPETDERYGVSTDILIRCFLPQAANKIFTEDNAKLSLVLEQMLRFLWTRSWVPGAVGLRQAIETGIAARNDKSRPRKTARGKNVEEAESEARRALDSSSKNLTVLADLIESSECVEVC